MPIPSMKGTGQWPASQNLEILDANTSPHTPKHTHAHNVQERLRLGIIFVSPLVESMFTAASTFKSARSGALALA